MPGLHVLRWQDGDVMIATLVMWHGFKQVFGYSGSLGYLRPQTAAFPARAGPEDDIRGLCAVGLELATGEWVSVLLDRQYQEMQKHKQAKVRFTELQSAVILIMTVLLQSNCHLPHSSLLCSYSSL